MLANQAGPGTVEHDHPTVPLALFEILKRRMDLGLHRSAVFAGDVSSFESPNSDLESPSSDIDLTVPDIPRHPVVVPAAEGPAITAFQRFIRRLTEKYLPLIHLTSYNNLLHSRALVVRLATELADVVWQRDNLASERSAIRARQADLSANLARLEGEAEKSGAAFDRLASERDELRDELIRRRSDHDRLEAEIVQFVEQRKQLELHIAEIRFEHGKLTGELAVNRSRLESMEATLRAKDATIEARDAALAAKDTALAATQDRLSTLLIDRERLASALSEISIVRDQYRHDLESERAQATQLVGAIEHLRWAVQNNSQNGQSHGTGALTFERLVELNHQLTSKQNLLEARDLLEEHFGRDNDPNLGALLSLYDQAIRANELFWDIRLAARVSAKVLAPATFLEVGTRRGWSLAQVLTEAPDVRAYIFETWTPDYAGAQGSPESVLERMRSVVGVGRQPRIEFVNGSSHDTLPRFFSGELEFAAADLPVEFDLISVDGDHSRLGAWWDLVDLLPRVKLGGVLLFDDLHWRGDETDGAVPQTVFDRPELPASVSSLLDVWTTMQARHPNFVFLTPPISRYSCGVAFRIA